LSYRFVTVAGGCLKIRVLKVILAKDVVLAPDDRGIQSMTVYKSSKNRDKFELLTIDETAPDTEYYFIIEYARLTQFVRSCHFIG